MEYEEIKEKYKPLVDKATKILKKKDSKMNGQLGKTLAINMLLKRNCSDLTIYSAMDKIFENPNMQTINTLRYKMVHGHGGAMQMEATKYEANEIGINLDVFRSFLREYKRINVDKKPPRERKSPKQPTAEHPYRNFTQAERDEYNAYRRVHRNDTKHTKEELAEIKRKKEQKAKKNTEIKLTELIYIADTVLREYNKDENKQLRDIINHMIVEEFSANLIYYTLYKYKIKHDRQWQLSLDKIKMYSNNYMSNTKSAKKENQKIRAEAKYCGLRYQEYIKVIQSKVEEIEDKIHNEILNQIKKREYKGNEVNLPVRKTLVNRSNKTLEEHQAHQAEIKDFTEDLGITEQVEESDMKSFIIPTDSLIFSNF